MRPHLEDLRQLKLAELYEMAYERFILDVALRTAEGSVRDTLLKLGPAGEGHGQRIAEEMERINAELTPEEREEVTRAALLDVVDVERAARDMYLGLADKVHDPRLVRLFRSLAKEEEAHVKLALDLVVLADAPREQLDLGGRHPGLRRVH